MKIKHQETLIAIAIVLDVMIAIGILILVGIKLA
jgi:hypothetical protein